MKATDERECLHCGQTKAQIKSEQTICGIEGGYEYRELEYEWPHHRWADWRDAELAAQGVKPEAFDRHRRASITTMQWIDCEDTVSGHAPATTEDLPGLATRIGHCILCGREAQAIANPSSE